MYLSVNSTMVVATCKFSGYQKVFRLSKWCGSWVLLPRDIALHHCEFTAQNFDTVQLAPSGRVPLNTRLGGPHSRSGCFGEEEKSLLIVLVFWDVMSLVTQLVTQPSKI